LARNLAILTLIRYAARDIDLRPERYTHYYKNEFPERFHAMMDTRSWGRASGSYSRPTRAKSSSNRSSRIAEHQIFAEGRMGPGEHDRSTISFAEQ
jgi:hypothetical protein